MFLAEGNTTYGGWFAAWPPWLRYIWCFAIGLVAGWGAAFAYINRKYRSEPKD